MSRINKDYFSYQTKGCDQAVGWLGAQGVHLEVSADQHGQWGALSEPSLGREASWSSCRSWGALWRQGLLMSQSDFGQVSGLASCLWVFVSHGAV